MRRVALSAALLLLAILIQLTTLNNVRLPRGAGPDLVLVLVVALALTGGPLEGMLGGFCAGLALDVAPPATHLVGQYALVFCLVGYAAGRVGSKLDESAWVPIGVVAVGSAVGELLFALTGMIFGNLDITWSTVGQACPASPAGQPASRWRCPVSRVRPPCSRVPARCCATAGPAAPRG